MYSVCANLCDNIGVVLAYLPCRPISQHHLACMPQPSLSCLLYFLCMLAIPIYSSFEKFEEVLNDLSCLLFHES